MLHARIQVANAQAERAQHEQRWEDEAIEQSQSREFRGRLAGKGTVRAADVRIEEAHRDNQILSSHTPEAPSA